jgi:hypothetical protein
LLQVLANHLQVRSSQICLASNKAAAGRGRCRERRRHSPHAARGRDVSVEAGLGRVRVHRLWQPQASRAPIPDVRARVAAIELLLREGLGRPAQAEEPPPRHNCPAPRLKPGHSTWIGSRRWRSPTPRSSTCPKRSGSSGWSAAGSDSRSPNGTAFAPHSTRPRPRAEHSIV